MMAPLDLVTWRALLGLPQTLAAEELEIGLRTFKQYEAGEAPIPRMLELACAALSLGIRRFPSQVHAREDDPVRPLDLPATAGLGLSSRERELLRGIIQGRKPKVTTTTSRWMGRLYRAGLLKPLDAPTAADPAGQIWDITERGTWTLAVDQERAPGLARAEEAVEAAREDRTQAQKQERPAG